MSRAIADMHLRAVPGLPEGCAVRRESDGFVVVTDGEMFGPYATEREAVDAAWGQS